MTSRAKVLAGLCGAALVLAGGLRENRSWVRTPALSAGEGFDGERAFEDLEQLVQLGPRPPASEALGKARHYLGTELVAAGAKVSEDSFVSSTPVGTVPMTNVIGVIPGQSPSVVIIAGHYETARLDGVNFVGANDGGSSAALLLEMGRVLAKHKNAFTYWLVFFDGEEALKQWSASDSLYGSRHMADQLERDGRLKNVRAFILVDMVGDRHLNILREANSTPWLSDVVFESARQLGYGSAFNGGVFPVEDDHLPFLKKGVPAVDIIDVVPFQSYHHTDRDTIDKCGPESLALVGRVVLATLDVLERRGE